MSRRVKVLFLCYGNACRSQMAEGFARALGGERIEALSAGLAPLAGVPQLTVAVMAEKGIDIRDQYSKSLMEVWDRAPEVIINMSGVSVPLPEGVRVEEWDIEDPYGAGIEAYRKTRAQVEARVREWIDRLRGESAG